MAKRVLIVGGSAGGASTAVRLRRLDESAEITILEKDNFISYANCGLPYYIGDVIKEREKLFMASPEVMRRRFRIDVRTDSEVTEVNTSDKWVQVRTRDGRQYEKGYDYLVLAPGAKPLIPDLPGIESSRIFTIRNISDADRIKEYLDKNRIKKALVVGGGYVGIEIAENLVQRKIEVVLLENAEHVLDSFAGDMTAVVEKELSDNGVTMVLKDGLKAFKEVEEGIEAQLNSGRTLQAEIVILTVGTISATGFLHGSTIALDSEGRILVDNYLKTSAENVFALGAAVKTMNYITGEKTALSSAGITSRQARIAADNICGMSSVYEGAQGTVIVKVFKLAAGSTGANEQILEKNNITYRTAIVYPMAHAAFYPGSSELYIKLLFAEDGKILGAQAIGYEAVDKTIDVLAAVIRMKGTVQDLTELELAYAPPFSSAKSPVNMAGFVGENILQGRMDVFEPKQSKDFKNTFLVDVRTTQEYENGHMRNAVNIPVDELRSRLDELDKNMEILVYCQMGIRGYIASRILEQNGFKVKNMSGGYKTAAASEFNPDQCNHQENEKSSEKEGAISGTEPQEAGKKDNVKKEEKISKEVDASGLSCPGPLMSVKSAVDEMKSGEVVRARASDPGFYEDIKSWCNKTNNELMSLNKDGSSIIAEIRKGGGSQKPEAAADKEVGGSKDNKTIIVFSGDLDKAIAAFIIANGAAAMGKKVTMFFTFWGINILRKSKRVKVDKGFIEKMFGAVMPRGSRRLKLSKMNMAGAGPKMIRGIMKKKNVNSLEELMRSGMDSGIEMVACEMSMDLLGLKKQELMDGVKIGGVGYYIGETEDSNLNLFI